MLTGCITEASMPDTPIEESSKHWKDEPIRDEPVRAEPVDSSVPIVKALNASLQRTRRQQWAIAARVAPIRKQEVRLHAQRKRLHRTNQRLKANKDKIKSQIAEWEANRTFHPILRLPLELRDLIWNEYFDHSPDNCIQSGLDKAIVQTCPQLRKEYIDWLCRMRPIYIEFVAEVHWSPKSAHVLELRQMPAWKMQWSHTSKKFLRRARNVNVRIKFCTPGCRLQFVADWTLNLVSGDLRVRCEEAPSYRLSDAYMLLHWRPAIVADWTLNLVSNKVTGDGYFSMVTESKGSDELHRRILVVLRAVMQRGELRKSDTDLLFQAIAGPRGTHRMRKEEAARRVEMLELLPFANADV